MQSLAKRLAQAAALVFLLLICQCGRFDTEAAADRWTVTASSDGTLSGQAITLPWTLVPESKPGPFAVTLRRSIEPEWSEHCAAPSGVLAIKVGPLRDVASFTVNGVELGRTGSLQPYQSGDGLHLLTLIPCAVVRQEESPWMEIALSSPQAGRLAIESEPIFGPAEEVLAQTQRTDLINAALIALYIGVGAYHLLLFLRRSGERYYLYFGLLALSLSAFWLARMQIVDSVFAGSGLWRQSLELGGLLMAMPLWLGFTDEFLRKRTSAIAFLTLAIAAALLLWSILESHSTGLPLLFGQALITVGVLYSFYRIARDAIGKRREALQLLAPGILVGAAVIHDVGTSIGLYRSSHITLQVFPLLMVLVAGLLASRFVDVFREAQRLNVELEDRVAQRTRELEDARRELVEVDRQKTRFFQNVSHELRTPLTLILGPLENALNGGAALGGDSLQVVHGNARRLLKLVNELLELQKASSGQLRLQARPLDLFALLNSILESFGDYCDLRQIRLHREVADDLPLAHADAESVEKCVFNFLSNAVKFTGTGGRIVVRATVRESKIRIEVSDNGAGIPAEQLQALFQRFGQSTPAVAGGQVGSGLGLALVKELVELQGGEVGAESAPGEGSLFWFTVPIARSDAVTADDDGSASQEKTDRGGDHKAIDGPKLIKPPSGKGNGARILVLDDNRQLREFIGGSLSAHGYTILTAPDGPTALDQLDSFRPDLVITDLMMPRMSGIEFTNRLRRLPEHATTPIVLLTARADEETRREVREAGADDFLAKPFQEQELSAVVRNAIALKRREKVMLNELRMAREVQKSILPGALPPTPGLRVAARFLPMEEVGGDLYDVVPLGDGRSLFFLGDVSGHGVPAAMVAAMTSLSLHWALQNSRRPEAILSDINVSLHGRVGFHYLTAQLLLVDPRSGELSFAVAAHPPVLLLRNGAVDFLPPGGRFLALEPESVAGAGAVPIQRGDRFLIYSDAITEAMDPQGVFFGAEGLAAAAAKSEGDLERWLDAIVAAVDAHQQDSRRNDDLTLLAFEVL